MSKQQQNLLYLRKAMIAMMAFEWIQISMGSVAIASSLVLACVIIIPFPFYAALLWPVKRWVHPQKVRKVVNGCLAFRAFMVIIGNVFANELLRIAPQFFIGIAAMVIVMRFTPDVIALSLGRVQKIMLLPAIAVFFAAGFMPPAIHTSATSTVTPLADSPNIVLLSWDTIRADVLSLYGGTGLDTPNLDKFAKRSVVFDDAVAHTPITGPEHALMLTGVLPPSNGLRANVLSKIPESISTLPEQLSAKGYSTGGFVSAYPMLGRFGLQQGFDEYNDRMAGQPMIRFKQLSPREVFWSGLLYPLLRGTPKASTAGSVVQQRALTWLEQQDPSRPYFMFLHLYDAHAPYLPPVEFAEVAMQRKNTALPKAIDVQATDAMAMYRAEIAMLDSFFGDLIAELEKRDPGLGNTLLIFTSDHGECFGEGGILYNHVPSLFEATQHIPLIVHFPKDQGAGMRVLQTVTHLDILPTCLIAAGDNLEDAPQDVASYPLQLAYSPRGLDYESRDVYLEAQQTTLADERLRGWRTADIKYLLSRVGAEQLFSYRDNEVENLIDLQPQVASKMKVVLLNFFNGLQVVDGSVDSVSAQDLQAMGQLGYTD